MNFVSIWGLGRQKQENCLTISRIDLRYAWVIGCMQIKNYLMNGWNINAKGLEKKMGRRYNENGNIYFTIFLSLEERKVGMGKELKGKELGKGISQRADGRYIARFTSKTGKRKTLYDFK